MNALMREKSEAFVTGNETIEHSIASLREKMDRDHAALAASQAALSERVHQNYVILSEKIHTSHLALRDKIDQGDAALSAGLAALRDKMGRGFEMSNAKIDALSKDLGTAFAELRGLHKTVLWVCGGVVTVVTLSVSVGKALGWF
jgi:hypothetical protein